MPATLSVEPAGSASSARLGQALGRAFSDDPVFRWLLPEEDRRVHRLPALFAVLLRRFYLGHGACEVVVREGHVLGGALWLPPGAGATPLAELAGALPGLAAAVRSRMVAGIQLLAAIEGAHPPEPHWYLGVLGTDPLVQRRGVGRALLRSRLDRCDETGLSAYLETFTEANVAYYQGFGFEVRQELRVGRRGPRGWTMLRCPA